MKTNEEINMINFIKKLFYKDTKENEIELLISYYNKRLMDEINDRKDKERYIYEKMYKYRDKLIEHGIFDLEE